MGTPIFATDFQLIDDCDTTTNWGIIVGGKAISEPDNSIQGAGGIGTEAKAVGIKGVTYDMGAGGTAMSGTHLMMWVTVIGKQFVNTKGASGVFIRIQDTGGNSGDWVIGGSDVAWVGQGYKLFVVEVNRPFDRSTGYVDRNNIRYVGAAADFVSAVSKSTAITLDIMRYGTRFEVVGGSGADPITFQDIIDKDQADDTYYGMVSRDKNGNLELNGNIYIGDPSGLNIDTAFYDSGEIAVFTDNPVASGFYKLSFVQASGSSTLIRLGEPISSGANVLGSKGITIISDETEWAHKPIMDFRDSLDELGIYALKTANIDTVLFGSTSGYIDGSTVTMADSDLSDVGRVVKNMDISVASPTLVRNKISFARDLQASIDLVDKADLDSEDIDVIQSRGFIHTPSGIDILHTIEYDFTTFLKPYVTVAANETWNIVNPSWTVYPSGQDEIDFLNGTNNEVNEKFDIDVVIAQPDGTAISGAHTWAGETSPSIFLPSGNRQTTDAAGFATSRYLTNTYTDQGGSGLNTNPHTDTFFKSYYYGRSPFATSLGTVSAKQTLNITLVTDANISETDQATAQSDGAGIVVTRDQTTPFAIIGFASGNGGTILAGNVVAGVTSNASGVYIETVDGDTTEGKILLEDIDGTFIANEELDIVLGAGTWDNANFDYGTQQEFTWGINASGLTMQKTYDYLSANIAESDTNIADIFRTAIEWGEDENSLLVQAEGGDSYKTERTVRITEGVVVYNRGAGTISKFTADDGTTFTPPVSYALTLTDLKTASEVRVYENVGGSPGTELAGTESSSDTFQYTYTYQGSDVDVIVVIFHLNWLPIRLFLTLSNSDQTIPIQQSTDRIYSNP
jgi:hypothetical protein